LLLLSLLSPTSAAAQLVVVPQGTALHVRPDAKSQALEPSSTGELTFAIVGEEGDWVAITNDVGELRGRLCHRPLRTPAATLRLWVRKDSLATVTTTGVKAYFRDGSFVHVPPGAAIKAADDGGWATHTTTLSVGKRLPLTVPPAATGRSFVFEPLSALDSTPGVREGQNLSFLVDGARLVLSGMIVASEVHRGRLRQIVHGRCARVGGFARIPAIALLSSKDMGLTGFGGIGGIGLSTTKKAGKRRWHVAEDTPLHVADGTLVGVTTRELVFRKGPKKQRGRSCFRHKWADLGEHELTLCFPNDAVTVTKLD
jgi:hypothetical protein